MLRRLQKLFEVRIAFCASTVLVLMCSTCSPSAAVASQPVAGVPFHVALSHSAAGTDPGPGADDRDPALGVAVLPPGIACPASYTEVVGDVYSNSWHYTAGDPRSEPFVVDKALTVDRPGTYTVCSYLALEGLHSIDADPEATIQQYTPVAVTVARPTVALSVAQSVAAPAGSLSRLVGTITANAPENWTLHLNPQAKACADTAALNAPDDALAGAFPATQAYGGPIDIKEEVTAPPAGVYRLCVYASRDGKSGDPDLAAEVGTFTSTAVIAQPAPTTPTAVPSGLAIVASPDAAVPQSPAITTLADRTPGAAPSCTLSRHRVVVGGDVWIRCPGVSGTVEVRAARDSSMRTASLRLSTAGSARLRTGHFGRGTWTVRIYNKGTLLAAPVLVVRVPSPR